MRKERAWVFLTVILLAAVLSCARATAEQRALIITSDLFLSAPETSPSAASNAVTAEGIFRGALAPFARISVLSDTIASQEAFSEAVRDAFSEASEDDVSYLYISTHGIAGEVPALLLSDGTAEYRLTPDTLRAVLDEVKGLKVILIDACHSGAFIGKGGNGLAVSHVFTGSDYKVMASAGADEESWFWQYGDAETPYTAGAGYFTDILAMGLSSRGNYAADLNGDGYITLAECYTFLLDNHGASTPRVYPENDPFVLLAYAPKGVRPDSTLPDSALTAFTCERGPLRYTDPELLFEFTALRPAQIAYQLVYFSNHRWAFDSARLIYDGFETGGAYGDRRGAVAPGRKTRSLELRLQDDGSHGYVMLQILTISDGMPSIHFSRIFAVPPMGGDPKLAVMTAPSFQPSAGEEMPVFIAHDPPLEVSVYIEDQQGRTAAKLRVRSGTRPEHLASPGSMLYWDGRQKDGTPAPEGVYRVRATAFFPSETYTAYSDAFILKGP